MKAKSFSISKERANILRKKALEFSIKADDFIKESAIINFLVDEFIDKLEYENNKIINKDKYK
jgi:hypothetical protein